MSDKLCIKCKHYVESSFESHKAVEYIEIYNKHLIDTIPSFDSCSRNAVLEKVKGMYITSTLLNCAAERENAKRLEHFRCGYEGKYFEKYNFNEAHNTTLINT